MADYISQFTGGEIDRRLAKVSDLEAGKQDKLESGENIKTVGGQSLLGAGNIPLTDQEAVKFTPQTLTDEQKAQALANIGAASEDEVAALADQKYEGPYATTAALPTASASTMGAIYLVGPDGNGEYDRYVTKLNGSTYTWGSLGKTSIDLSNYATKAEVDELEAKVDGLENGKFYPSYTLTTGKMILSNGQLYNTADYSYTSAIHLRKGEKITVVSTGKNFAAVSVAGTFPVTPLVAVTVDPGDGVQGTYSYIADRDIDVFVCVKSAYPYEIYEDALFIKEDNKIINQIKVFQSYPGKYMTDGNTVNTNASYELSGYIPFENDLTLVGCTITSSIKVYHFDENKNYIGYFTLATGNNLTIFLSKYIRFSSLVTNKAYVLGCLGGVIGEFEDIRNRTELVNDFFINDGLLLKTGDISASTSFKVTDYLPFAEGAKILLKAYSGGTTYTNYVSICYYDATKTILANNGYDNTRVGIAAGTSIKEFTAPSGTKYIRCCCTASNKGFILAPILPYAYNELAGRVSQLETNPDVRFPVDESDGLLNYSYFKYTNGVLERVIGGSVPEGFYSKIVPVELGDIIVSTGQKGTISGGSGAQIANLIVAENGSYLGTVTFTQNPGENFGSFQITQDFIDLGGVAVGVSFSNTNSNMSGDSTTRVIVVKKSITQISNEITQLEETQKKRIKLPNITYRGFAPDSFKNKILAMEDEVNVVLVGDSMTALTNIVGPELEEAPNLPPGCNRDAITLQLWERICTNKPQFDRFDSLVNTFTENGTWQLSPIEKQNNVINPGDTDATGKGEYSEDNCIYRETGTTNDYVEFDWDLDDYEKLDFIGRMSAYDGTTGVTISCTSGKVKVYDTATSSWVEANGYTFSQKLILTGDAYEQLYQAEWLRKIPVKMKKAEGATGEIILRFTNTGTGTFYYWGTERWNHTTVHLTNIARAGRNLELLHRNLKSELQHRDIDLIIFQLPLWNEFKNGGNPLTGGTYPTLTGISNVIEDMKSESNDFARFQTVFTVYHTQVFSWDGNKNLPFRANGTGTPTDLPDYQLECRCIKYIKDYIANAGNGIPSGTIKVTNFVNEFFNMAQSNGITMETFLTNNNLVTIFPERFLYDGVHLTSVGFGYYTDMIAPMIFD